MERRAAGKAHLGSHEALAGRQDISGQLDPLVSLQAFHGGHLRNTFFLDMIKSGCCIFCNNNPKNKSN